MIYFTNNSKIILVILSLIILSIIFILIINKNIDEEFVSDSDILKPVQQKMGLEISSEEHAGPMGPMGPMGLQGPPGQTGLQGKQGYPGRNGSECKCKLPLFKFIDQGNNILAKHPITNYPTSQEIIDKNLIEITIIVPRGNDGAQGLQGPIGPSGFSN